MKIIVIGDIHGKLIWNDIVKNDADKIIFLGDYVDTHGNESKEQQLSNLEDILTYKENNPDKVILLRGNHDGYAFNDDSCSSYSYAMQKRFPKERFINNTQWIYSIGNIIFSHAGVSKVWMDNCRIKHIDEINNLPSTCFMFTSGDTVDYCGAAPTQPPTWIRPWVLTKVALEGYTQVFGHTPVKEIEEVHSDSGDLLLLCDTLNLDKYLVLEIDNNQLTSINYESTNKKYI